MSTTVATLPHAGQPDRQRREITPTDDAVPMLDTAKFEHMQRIANVMASTSMIPDALRKVKVGSEMTDLPPAQVVANCFLVVNQSVRWGMDPFAVAQCVSIVHGKLCYEGKLVSAVLDAKLGLKLFHHLTGAPGDTRRIYLSDRPFDQTVLDQLAPGVRFLDRRMFDGSVAEWKTTGANSPWSPKNFDRMLVYRGTRDWCRIYEPAIMLGVYTPDEMLDLSENVRAERARDVGRPTLQDRIASRQSVEVNRAEGFGYEQTRALEGNSPAAIEGPKGNLPAEDESAHPEPQVRMEPASPPDADEHFPGAANERGAEIDPRFDPATADKLTRYARDVLAQATGDAEPTILRDRIGKTHARWRTDMADFPEAATDVARKALSAAQAIVKGDTDLSTSITFLADEIGVPEADLQPGAN